MSSIYRVFLRWWCSIRVSVHHKSATGALLQFYTEAPGNVTKSIPHLRDMSGSLSGIRSNRWPRNSQDDNGLVQEGQPLRHCGRDISKTSYRHVGTPWKELASGRNKKILSSYRSETRKIVFVNSSTTAVVELDMFHSMVVLCRSTVTRTNRWECERDDCQRINRAKQEWMCFTNLDRGEEGRKDQILCSLWKAQRGYHPGLVLDIAYVRLKRQPRRLNCILHRWRRLGILEDEIAE